MAPSVQRRKVWLTPTAGAVEQFAALLRLDVYQVYHRVWSLCQQEGQHPLTGQRAANFRLLANQ